VLGCFGLDMSGRWRCGKVVKVDDANWSDVNMGERTFIDTR